MRVRFVEFKDDQVVNMPGRQGARNAHAFDPEHPERGGFDLEIDFERQVLRYVVPKDSQSIRNGAARWFSDEVPKRPADGSAPVGYVTLGVVKRFELFADM